MTALPPVPNVMRVDIKWHVGGDSNAGTTLHYTYTGGPPSVEQCVELATAIDSAISGPSISGCLSPDSAYIGTEVIDLSSDTGSSGSAGTETSGARVGAALPASICFLANYTIARRYRGGKPRSYLPFGTAADVSPNLTQWTTTAVTSLQAAWQTTLNAIKAASAGGVAFTDHVNVSYYGPPDVFPTHGERRALSSVRANPIVDVIAGMTLNQRISSQRRRIARG